MKTTATLSPTILATGLLPQFTSRLNQLRQALALRARRCATTFVVTLLSLLSCASQVAAGGQVQIKGTAASQVAAGGQVQIKGTASSGNVDVIPLGPTVLLYHGIGPGQATYLGTFMLEVWLFVDSTPGSASAYGQYKLTTPNGATINADFTAVGVPTEEDPNVIHFMETGIITGGTGRFAGATGIITREGLNNMAVSTLGGTISTPGMSRK